MTMESILRLGGEWVKDEMERSENDSPINGLRHKKWERQ